MRKTILVVVAIVGLAPVTLIATWLLFPVWSWIEARWGIEAIGHSGPSEWCYGAVYGCFLAIALFIWVMRQKLATPDGSRRKST